MRMSEEVVNNGVSFTENILEHFGVKGMQWGVSTSGGSGSRKSSLPKEAQSTESKNAQSQRTRAKTSGRQALTNKELQDYITRANLEQQFSNLSASKFQKGVKATISILGNIGKQQATMLATRKITGAVKTALNA